jgi:serine/threonine-protein kinase
MEDMIGKVIDNYRILEILGRGGMGVVYKAMDEGLHRVVALKMLNPFYVQDENFLIRFRREARSQARLEHPNIVRIHAFRESQEGLFIVMGFVDGKNLSQLIKEMGTISWQHSMPIFKQCLSAIGYAHQLGVIHRDIKPRNIMINRNGEVKITDFGLAKVQEGGETTITQGVAGTLYYMSPEQVQGMSKVDHRSDLYSLGMTFYEMLAGRTPFNKNDSEFTILKSIVESNFPSPTQLNPAMPPILSKIVMKAVSNEPAKRYQAAEEMLRDLEKFEAMQKIPPRPAPRPLIQNWTRYAIPIVGLLLVLIFILTGAYRPILNLFSPSGTPPVQPAKLSISSNPSQAVLFINEDSVGVTPVTDYTIPPGSTRVKIDKKGFRVIDTLLVLEESQTESLDIKLRAIPKPKPGKKSDIKPPEIVTGTLFITSRPEGATVHLDGVPAGSTPYRNDKIKPGSYNVKIFREGYQEVSRRITVRRGQTVPLHVALRAFGFLTVDSEPGDADVFVNGRKVAATPFTNQSYLPGEYEILIKKTGYEDFSTLITIKPSQPTNISKSLRRLRGTLRVLVRPYGTIYIDGVKKAENMNRLFSIDLQTGAHKITVEHGTLGTIEKEINIPANETTTLNFDFNQQFKITIITRPVIGAEILVDGNSRGYTPKQLTLSIGKHTIEVRKNGYRVKEGKKVVNLEASIQEPFVFTLEKNQ